MTYTSDVVSALVLPAPEDMPVCTGCGEHITCDGYQEAPRGRPPLVLGTCWRTGCPEHGMTRSYGDYETFWNERRGAR